MPQLQQPLSRSTTVAIGAIAAAAGGYFILVSLGMVPPPGRRNPHDPLWIVFCAGLAFLLGGLAVVNGALAGAREGELPPNAPRWVRLTQYVMGLAITACLAATGTWIALGAGPRSFSMSGPLFDTTGVGEMIGRTAFGIGALITWLCLIALAINGAGKLFGRRRI